MIRCPCPRDRVRNRQKKIGEAGRGDGEVSENSHGKRVEVLVDAMPKAPIGLLHAALASGVQNCGCKRAGGVYISGAQGAKTEILVKMEIPDEMKRWSPDRVR